MNIRKYIKDKKKLIDNALDKYLPTSNTKPAALHKAMRYAVFPGGKRIRPILTIAGFEACGGRGNSIMPLACAMEIIHTYTLIHDDLPCMDDDNFRRGRPSCHKRFNEGVALLAGDALLTLGFQLLSEAGNAEIINEVSMAIGSCGTIGGQAVDIEKSKLDLNYIATHKTGELFRVSVKIAGMFKGVDKNKIKGLESFGKHIGLTFQLVDDLIDMDGYAAAYGVKHTKEMAGLFAARAKSSLSIFGNKANRLLEIVDLILRPPVRG